MRVEEGICRSQWTKKDGHGHAYGTDDEESGEVGSNQHKRSKGVTGACSACGSSTHKRTTHRDCSGTYQHCDAVTPKLKELHSSNFNKCL